MIDLKTNETFLYDSLTAILEEKSFFVKNEESVAVLAETILLELQMQVDLENTVRDKSKKIPTPKTLSHWMIYEILIRRYRFARIPAGNIASKNGKYDEVYYYCNKGPQEGIYVSAMVWLDRIVLEMNRTFGEKDCDRVYFLLLRKCEVLYRTTDRSLIAVNNGIFDYDTKQLLPFSEDYVFTSKSSVDYKSDAKNVVIHNDDDGTDWDLESWFKSIHDNPEVQTLLWQILGAIIRPNVSWNKTAWLYSRVGNNGKGSLCKLMRGICGEGNHASIPIDAFGKDFLLEHLPSVSAVITDENDVGIYIDKAANFKAVVTGDIIQINIKHGSPLQCQFRGFMVQCINELPKAKDTTDSFFRRQLVIPMTKKFTGIERKYIKDDYLERQEVLEYALYRVLNMNYYELDEPKECLEALSDYKSENNPVLQYYEEFFDEFQWDFLPFGFLYDLYKSWMERTNPNGRALSKNNFISELTLLLDPLLFEVYAKNRVMPGRNISFISEPLIEQYDLQDWMAKYYKGADRSKKCRPDVIKSSYRGIKRLLQKV